MKKILMIVMALTFMLVPVKAQAKDKVTIYLFRGATCSHCEEALEYISNNRDRLDGYEFVTYEVWKNKDNASLQQIVADKVGVSDEDKTSVPLFVIGDKHVIGYGSSTTFDRILSIASEFKDSDDYKDVVEEAKKELKAENASLTFEANTLNDLYPEPSKTTTIVVYVIFGVLILGFIGMIVFSRSK